MPGRAPRHRRFSALVLGSLAGVIQIRVGGLLLASLLLASCVGSDLAPPAPMSPSPTGASAAASLLTVPPLHPSVDGYPETIVLLRSPDGDEEVTLPVKVAATAETRRHGLMEVRELPAGTGMLFAFPGERAGGFWMFNTHVALDIAFVDAAGRIGTILAMQPCPQPSAGRSCPTYAPDHGYTAALEVAQGWFASVGVTAGWLMEADMSAVSVG
ncbi:MAG: DUF192 domain-containing protein [Actinobacteria bacterium]|nr:DUF192 domain-containing protein [Actinomycetota bacterium]